MARITFSKTTVEGSAYLGYNSKFSNDHLQMFDSRSSLTVYAEVASHLGATDHLPHLAAFRNVKANPKFLSPSFFTVHLKLNTRACTVRTPVVVDRVCSITRRRRSQTVPGRATKLHDRSCGTMSWLIVTSTQSAKASQATISQPSCVEGLAPL
jgi:hypothetical protein